GLVHAGRRVDVQVELAEAPDRLGQRRRVLLPVRQLEVPVGELEAAQRLLGDPLGHAATPLQPHGPAGAFSMPSSCTAGGGLILLEPSAHTRPSATTCRTRLASSSASLRSGG